MKKPQQQLLLTPFVYVTNLQKQFFAESGGGGAYKVQYEHRPQSTILCLKCVELVTVVRK